MALLIAVSSLAAERPSFGVQQGAEPAPRQGPPDDELSDHVFELLNAERRAAGLDELRRHPVLTALAQRHSTEQARRGAVSHHSYEYNLSTERRVRIAFPEVPRLAENVARNGTVERLHRALMRSAGHRRNRLDEAFTHVGIAVARADPHMLYLTEVFVTVADEAELARPIAMYFDAAPGAYEARDNPRVERGPETITVGPPGPDDPEHWTNKGIDAFSAGDLEAAAAHFRTALALDAEYEFASYNLARTLVEQGDYDPAVELLDELLRADPEDTVARFTRGSAALLMGDYVAAAQAFRDVIEARPRDATAWYNLGLALEYLDRPADAGAAYRQALHIEPGLTAAHVGLARVSR